MADPISDTRRSFIKRLALAVGALWAGRATAASAKHAFYVAGVRYHQPQHQPVTGDRVALVRETYQGAGCFAIYSSRGERIGYAPRECHAMVERSGVSTGRVILANPYAMPWRRYQVELG